MSALLAEHRPSIVLETANNPAARRRQSSGVIGAGTGFGARSTSTIAATTSASAVHSLGPGRSPRNSMPENTPTIGTGSDDIDDTTTGSVRASVNHAQCATVPARKML